MTMTKTQATARVKAAEEAVARFPEGADAGDYSSTDEREWRRTHYGETLRALEQRRAQLAELS